MKLACHKTLFALIAAVISSVTWAGDNIIRTTAPITFIAPSESWMSTTPSYSEWIQRSVNCGAWTPGSETITAGQSFTQTRLCDLSESRTVQPREISSSGAYRNAGESYSENRLIAGGSTETQEAVGSKTKLDGKYLFGTAFSGTSNAEGYSVSDSYHADTRGGWLMFDTNLKSMWYPEASYASAYTQVNAPSPIVLRSLMTHYDLSGTSLNTGYFATSITIKGSNDGVNYTTIATRPLTYAQTGASTYNSGVVSVPNSVAYKYYRISIAPTSHPYVGLQTLILSSETTFEL